jgi:hypothetical protein
MDYRRPTFYLPPYAYCDRECGGCAIDKARCMLYQRETDERLHREIDGSRPPNAGERSARLVREAEELLSCVEEIDLPPAEPAPAFRDPEADAAASEGSRVMRLLTAFLREQGAEIGEELRILRRLLPLTGPRLARAAAPPSDAEEEAIAILQAQASHQALGRILDSLERVRRARPDFQDGLLDLLSALQALRARLEAHWLSRPSALLEPVGRGSWWGPLRDAPAPSHRFPA